MPNKLKAGTLRVSYVESIAINRAISILASVKGVTISSLIREATEQYLTREDPNGAILRAAKELVAGQSESVDQRVIEPVNPEVIAKLAALIKKSWLRLRAAPWHPQSSGLAWLLNFRPHPKVFVERIEYWCCLNFHSD